MENRFQLAAAVFSICLCLLSSEGLYAREKVKMYVGYTPSHAILVENWFRPSLVDSSIELVETLWEQTCKSANFSDEGWADTVVRKFDLLLRGVEENWGGVFIYSDVDIQFFGDFAQRAIECLGDNDVVFQRENTWGEACSGFIVCRGNERAKALWTEAKKVLASGKFNGDQFSINYVMRDTDLVPDLKWDFLPWQEFFGPGMTYLTHYWGDGVPLYVPKTIKMHHANFVVGIPSKEKQLKHVRDMAENTSLLSDEMCSWAERAIEEQLSSSSKRVVSYSRYANY